MILSKSEIMKTAWAAFRKTPSWWQTGDLRAKTFANELRKAWAHAKFYAAAAVKDAARKAEEAAREAQMNEAIVRNARAITAVRRAIDDLQFKSFRYDIAAERKVLETKLAGLMAA